MTDDLRPGSDGRPRCGWAVGSAEYEAYHDLEWGRPSRDDRALYEKLCLEGFQAGLSWLTILRKREGFRRAFAGFDIDAVAEFGPADVDRLLEDAGIVRHRAKIESAIINARAARAVRAGGGSLAELVWRYAPEPGPAPTSLAGIASRTRESTDLAAELGRRGFRFVGPTTAYAFMQAMGLVNDHLAGCCMRDRDRG